MAIPVDFDTLWGNLPQYFEIRNMVTNIPEGWETCCIQMSYALNKSGLSIDYKNKKRVHKFHGDEFMLDVTEMRGYLNENYPPNAEHISRVNSKGIIINRFALQASLDQRQGIIAFGGRHIDLWNGTRIHGEGYIQTALWEAKSAVRDGIFFWDVSAA